MKTLTKETLKKIFSVEHFPNWAGLATLAGLLWTIAGLSDSAKIESYKGEYLALMQASNSPIEINWNTEDEKNLRAAAIASLIGDGLVVSTATGYEFKRFDPRLKDDIKLASGLALEKNGYEFGQKSYILSTRQCDKLVKVVEDTENLIVHIEKMRERTDFKEKIFRAYLSSHRDVTVKEVLTWSKNEDGTLDDVIKCFSGKGYTE